MRQLFDTLTSLIALAWGLVSFMVLIFQTAAITPDLATPLALTKDCAAYSWGKSGWGCAPLDAFSTNPIPTLFAYIVLVVCLRWLYREQSPSWRALGAVVFISEVFFATVGRLTGYLFTGLAKPEYIYWLTPALLPAIALIAGCFIWLRSLDRNSKYIVENNHSERKQRADIAMEQEIHERKNKLRKP